MKKVLVFIFLAVSQTLAAAELGDFREPKLLTPLFYKKEDVCKDAREVVEKNHLHIQAALIMLAPHDCDTTTGECLKASRELADPANVFVRQNFVTYHTQFMQFREAKTEDGLPVIRAGLLENVATIAKEWGKTDPDPEVVVLDLKTCERIAREYTLIAKELFNPDQNFRYWSFRNLLLQLPKVRSTVQTTLDEISKKDEVDLVNRIRGTRNGFSLSESFALLDRQSTEAKLKFSDVYGADVLKLGDEGQYYFYHGCPGCLKLPPGFVLPSTPLTEIEPIDMNQVIGLEALDLEPALLIQWMLQLGRQFEFCRKPSGMFSKDTYRVYFKDGSSRLVPQLEFSAQIANVGFLGAFRNRDKNKTARQQTILDARELPSLPPGRTHVLLFGGVNTGTELLGGAFLRAISALPDADFTFMDLTETLGDLSLTSEFWISPLSQDLAAQGYVASINPDFQIIVVIDAKGKLVPYNEVREKLLSILAGEPQGDLL